MKTINHGWAIKSDRGYFVRTNHWNIHWDKNPTCADAWIIESQARKTIEAWDIQYLNPFPVEVYFDGVGYKLIDDLVAIQPIP